MLFESRALCGLCAADRYEWELVKVVGVEADPVLACKGLTGPVVAVETDRARRGECVTWCRVWFRDPVRAELYRRRALDARRRLA